MGRPPGPSVLNAEVWILITSPATTQSATYNDTTVLARQPKNYIMVSMDMSLIWLAVNSPTPLWCTPLSQSCGVIAPLSWGVSY